MFSHPEDNSHIRGALEEYVLSWPLVTIRFMFGCLAYMAKGKLFAFISDEGLVITNLDAESREALTESHEAFPFLFKDKPLGGWMQVIVAEETEIEGIMSYVRQSYEAALAKA